MEKNIRAKNEMPIENTLPIISPDRSTEESALKSNNNKNKKNLNNISNENNSSYIQLTTENSLNLNENNSYSQPSVRPLNSAFIKRSTQLKIFIPIVSLKILTPVFFMLKYIIYCFENEEDQNYCKYSICILTSLIFLCYFLAVFTPSSQTNVNKYFDEFKNNIYSIRTDYPGNELQNLNSSQWNDCVFCNSKKFIRSSHCRTCNKCVLLRDHHCPYIANCVGFKNIQYFFNFLFWGDLGMIFYVISFIKFQFFSNAHNSIYIPLYLKIPLYIDFGLSIFFVINIIGLMMKLFINVYNNRTQLENMRTAIVDYYFPICPKCARDFSRYNIEPEINFYNLGFLANIYYIIGPTPFHFIFPLPKYNNYILDENCPIFKKIKMIDRMDKFKFMVKNDRNNINILDNEESSPDYYIKACHDYYDGKKII